MVRKRNASTNNTDTARDTIRVRKQNPTTNIINRILARAADRREIVADAIGRPAAVEEEIEPADEDDEGEAEEAAEEAEEEIEKEAVEEGEMEEKVDEVEVPKDVVEEEVDVGGGEEMVEELEAHTAVVAPPSITEIVPLDPRPRLPVGILNEESEAEDEEEEEEFVASNTTVAQSRKMKWVDRVCDAVSEVSEFADDFDPDGAKCMLMCDRLGCKRVKCPSPTPHLLCFECLFKHVMHQGENCPFCRGQLSKKMRV